ncbi:uncharacterized protein LOC116845742 [Odontomachus brunneus]|uniref:uncharacterized protein LOC116845742 n=1 Tax=Odontomachus brunneus TaxID=486640 RepID=UPI0013F23069|nr:uncharacterized protein LOC116845742 [Odontomachus brunneus]
MPVCCITNCKSTAKRNCDIKFFRFPFHNKSSLKYWIAATGRDNWFPYSDARICSLHFINNDYSNNMYTQRKRLKQDIFPTQHVHANLLQLLQQNTVYKIKELNQNNDITEKHQLISPEKEQYDLASLHEEKDLLELHDGEQDQLTSTDIKQNLLILSDEKQNRLASPLEKQKLINSYDDNQTTLAISKCSTCTHYNKLLIQNEKLKKEIEEIKKLQEERLYQQASMFHNLINEKEAVLKTKLQMIKNKNNTLKKNIQRKEKTIINLKKFQALKSKNMLDADAAFKRIS